MATKIREFKLPTKRLKRLRDSTLSSKVKEYLIYRSVLYADRSYKIHAYALKEFSAWVGREQKKSIGPRTVLQFFTWCRVKGKSHHAMASRRGILNQFFNWCIKNGYLDSNPIEIIPPGTFTPEKKPRQSMTFEEYEKLKKAARGTELYYALVCAWHTAFRISDVCLLEWDDVDLESRLISRLPKKTKRGGKRAEVPISDELYELLSTRIKLKEDNEIYVSEELARYYKRGSSAINDKLSKIARPLGITKSWHSIRHAALERWVNHPNSDLVTVMDMSGHKTASTLAVYAKPSVEKKRMILGIEQPQNKTGYVVGQYSDGSLDPTIHCSKNGEVAPLCDAESPSPLQWQADFAGPATCSECLCILNSKTSPPRKS